MLDDRSLFVRLTVFAGLFFAGEGAVDAGGVAAAVADEDDILCASIMSNANCRSLDISRCDWSSILRPASCSSVHSRETPTFLQQCSSIMSRNTLQNLPRNAVPISIEHGNSWSFSKQLHWSSF